MTHIAQIDAQVFNVSDKTNWVFVSVLDSEGRTGWGEASLIGWEPLVTAAVHHLAPRWVGVSLEVLPEQLRVSPNSPGGLVFNTVVSAVAQATASLLAADQGLCPHEVLGTGVRSSVQLYANINRATRLRTPQGFIDTAQRAQSQGFRAFKAAPFEGLTPQTCQSTEGRKRMHHGIDCMLALRDALGPDVRLMVDCHWRFDEVGALETLKALESAQLHWFECPLAETQANWPAMRRIRQAARSQGVLLAAAETQVGLASFQTLFDENLYDVVMPDVKYCGGPWEMLRIARQAQAQGVQFSPHNPSGPVCTWHSLQVAMVAPECDLLEIQFDESPLYERLLPDPRLTPRDGRLHRVESSGTGLMLDDQLLASRPFQPVPMGVESQPVG